MHNLTKIKLFRILLWITYPISIIIIYPFVLIKRKQPSNLFFFFDRYAIGGAQRVHLDILESVSDIFKTIYFTRKSPNDKLRHEFYSIPNANCQDIHFWCDFLLLRIFSVHYYSFYINRHPGAKILSSNSTFFYDMLPFLSKRTYKIELLHNFSFGKKGMEFFGLANYCYLDKRMVIDAVTRENIIKQYSEFKIPAEYAVRIVLTEFGVQIPLYEGKPLPPPLKILYAGRGTYQKRIWLLNRIAERFISSDQVEFLFAGSMADELSDAVKSRYKVYNEIGDKNELNKLYKEAHAIILTSSFEGFPVTIKEGMSHGCIPIVTALPGIKLHLRHAYNALLIENPEDEADVVKAAIENITLLLQNPLLLQDLSANAYAYAEKNFRKDLFLKQYRSLLEKN